MAPTSDERRDVAAMLRWLAGDPGAQTRGPYGPDTYAITCDVIFGEPCYGPSEPQFLNRLADLIDPVGDVTTFALDEHSKDGEEVYPTRVAERRQS